MRTYPLETHYNLCKKPKQTYKGWVCGCREPKKCDGILAVREGMKRDLLQETKNQLLSVFE